MENILVVLGMLVFCVSLWLRKKHNDNEQQQLEYKLDYDIGHKIGTDLYKSGMSLEDIEKCFPAISKPMLEGIRCGVRLEKYAKIIDTTAKLDLKRLVDQAFAETRGKWKK